MTAVDEDILALPPCRQAAPTPLCFACRRPVALVSLLPFGGPVCEECGALYHLHDAAERSGH